MHDISPKSLAISYRLLSVIRFAITRLYLLCFTVCILSKTIPSVSDELQKIYSNAIIFQIVYAFFVSNLLENKYAPSHFFHRGHG